MAFLLTSRDVGPGLDKKGLCKGIETQTHTQR